MALKHFKSKENRHPCRANLKLLSWKNAFPVHQEVPQPGETFKTGDILLWTGRKGTTPPPKPPPPSPSCPSPPSTNNSNGNAKIRVTVVKKHETVIAAPRSHRGADLYGASTTTAGRTITPEEVSVFYDIRVDTEMIVQKVNGKELKWL